jgi:hypothetical protein
MKYTNGKIEVMATAISNLGKDKGLPMRIAYGFALIMKELEPILEALEAAKKSLIEKYADEGEQSINSSHENYPALLEELQPLMLEEVEVNIKLLAYDDFMAISQDVKLSDVMMLMELVEKPSED